mgnify:CR=1 FL=1
MPACIAWDNFADDDATVITSTSALPLTPVQEQLQNVHVGEKWRSNEGNVASIVINLGSARSIDTIALMGVSGNPVTRIRVSATDSTGLTGERYDSGSAANRVTYGYLVALITSPVSGRYIRIDLTDSAADYVEAGRLFVGLRDEFAVNFQPGWSASWVDRSRITEGRGGQTFIDVDNNFRTWDLTFGFLSEDDRNGFVEDIDYNNGAHTDVLLINNPDSSDLGRDCIWGLLESNAVVTQPHVIALFSKTYRIKERL